MGLVSPATRAYTPAGLCSEALLRWFYRFYPRLAILGLPLASFFDLVTALDQGHAARVDEVEMFRVLHLLTPILTALVGHVDRPRETVVVDVLTLFTAKLLEMRTHLTTQVGVWWRRWWWDYWILGWTTKDEKERE